MLKEIAIGDNFQLSLRRTIRVPNDGGTYPLPPGLGDFPIYPRLEIPKAHGLPEADYYVPMYQCEALWFRFRVTHWLPHAVQIAAGGIDVLTGESLKGELTEAPQNYVCCPHQLWLDGIRTAPGVVSQFVAVPLGGGQTLEEQFSSGTARGGVTIRLIPPKPGLFQKPDPEWRCGAFFSRKSQLGLGGGGRIEQKIYPDPHGLDTWDMANAKEIRLQILNSGHFEEMTGIPAPATPVTVAEYARLGLPWFRLYDETAQDIGATAALSGLETVRMDDPSLQWVRVKGIHPTS